MHLGRRGLLAAPLLLAAPASLAAWPDRPIRIIVTFPAGTQTDILTRLYTPGLAQRLGQPIVVDNRSGGQGVIGIRAAMGAPADGHTLLMIGVSTGASAPHMMKDLPYHPLRDLVPIGLVADAPYLLICDPRLPVHSAAELFAYARARPGQLSFAHGAPSRHVAGSLMARMAGIEALDVAYRGQPEATNDCAAGRISYTIADLGEALVQAREGRVRALAVTTADRSPLAPDIPAMSETLPGYNLSVWFMLGAAAGVPQPVVERINAALTEVMAEPGLRQQLAQQGLDIRSLPPEALKGFMATEVENWGRIIRLLNLQPS
ncbi:tripartite tricarboxylate transporter substrate binding protein [Siccirubricoccus sp. G192]|uniref:Bug family tripartite tricarboxylate transporter substrate binding protein n=1 Tax=Siccirubricoccus sp. G192 TaxID=2849651 RepID=UPI001C2C5B63|nr:tripartite tricarboxylate transporter substrate binding protein [Siccirubricoccus sp. G192]MBV1796644.1 tripartite tricarboxylate transporter substrate binding protein [Siccirubricoccus sp. G192]